METQLITRQQSAMPVPRPKEAIKFRPANAGDIDDLDKLQKQFSKGLGFMPKSWLEGKIARNEVLIAEIVDSSSLVVDSEGNSLPTTNNQLPTMLGYIIAQDRYMRRDDIGIVYQLVVTPGKQRGFIGAALLKAQFDRSAYGCRLYCCWCAQDLEANYFWESMGFYPLAYRNGSETKGKNGKPRVQIFWEKKIRGKDDVVNWWFPAKTEGGAMGADRLALPIPPGVHWRDLQPIEIPMIGGEKLLETDSPQSRGSKNGGRLSSRKIQRQPLTGGLRFALPTPIEEPKLEKTKRTKKPKAKIDPQFIKASRELRDRYLEQVNENGFKLESCGKYELTRDNNPYPLNTSPHPIPRVYDSSPRERGKTKFLEAA